MAKSAKKKKEQEEKQVLPEVELGEVQKIEVQENEIPLEVVASPTELTPIEPLKKEELEEIVKQYEPVNPAYIKELDKSLPFEERILAYLDSRPHSDFVKANDFLKSLYGVPSFNEPPKWANLSAMKSLNHLLDTMQAEGKIVVKNGAHKKLGKFYYYGQDQRLAIHDLSTISVEIKK